MNSRQPGRDVRPLKVCFVALYYDPDDVDPAAYLTRTGLHRHLPGALAARGHVVNAVHLFPSRGRFTEGGVDYHFVPAGAAFHALAERLGRRLGRPPAVFEPALAAIRTIRGLQPDLLHVHGTSLHLNLFLLHVLLGRMAPPVVLHYHGGHPSPNPFARRLQQFNLRRAARLLFTTERHAHPFVSAGVLAGLERVVPFMETSSTFRPRPRAEARRTTGLHGDPVFLWVGRLVPLKDPLTALRGFEKIVAARPGAQLYLYYRTDAMLPELRAYVAGRPGLAEHVHFQGTAPLAEMEAIYNSADFLLQASTREYSGCAVLEAMACGVIPVVTAIPSFEAMTDHGRYGALFPPGDADALARAVLKGAPEALPSHAAAVRRRFEASLSYAALARQLEAIYADVRSERPPIPVRHATNA